MGTDGPGDPGRPRHLGCQIEEARPPRRTAAVWGVAQEEELIFGGGTGFMEEAVCGGPQRMGQISISGVSGQGVGVCGHVWPTASGFI